MAERDGTVKGAEGGDDGMEGKILTGLWGVGCWVLGNADGICNQRGFVLGRWFCMRLVVVSERVRLLGIVVDVGLGGDRGGIGEVDGSRASEGSAGPTWDASGVNWVDLTG